jgi:hypothetical protein
MRIQFIALAMTLCAGAVTGRADVLTFGTKDCLTTGCYGTSDPTAGATLQGLTPGVSTDATGYFGHSYPFSPTAGDFPGTDQIYVGSVQTGSDDGYSNASQRINGPDVMVLNYSSLVPAGQTVSTLTLGIAADDFQFPSIGNPYIVTVNGIPDPALVKKLESLNESGPIVHFFTIGLDPTLYTGNTVAVSIDELGNGGDGWAVDFLTVGVTTTATPEPSEYVALACALAGLGAIALRRRYRLQ